MDLLDWLTHTNLGEMLFTMLVSMVPVIELRGGVPFGTALGLSAGQALVAAIIGNMIPIPFIIVYIRRIFLWMRRKSPKLNSLVDKLEKKLIKVIALINIIDIPDELTADVPQLSCALNISEDECRTVVERLVEN